MIHVLSTSGWLYLYEPPDPRSRGVAMNRLSNPTKLDYQTLGIQVYYIRQNRLNKRKQCLLRAVWIRRETFQHECRMICDGCPSLLWGWRAVAFQLSALYCKPRCQWRSSRTAAGYATTLYPRVDTPSQFRGTKLGAQQTTKTRGSHKPWY